MFAGNWRAADCAKRCLPVEGVSWRVALIDSCGGWPGRSAPRHSFPTGDGSLDGNRGRTQRSWLAPRATDHRAGGCGPEHRREGSRTVAGSGFLERAAGDRRGGRGCNRLGGGRRRRPHSYELRSRGRSHGARRGGEARHRPGLPHRCVHAGAGPDHLSGELPASHSRTGDARCSAGELSCLAPWFFGGCPHFEGQGQGQSHGQAAAGSDSRGGRGASVGAAWVTRSILGTGNLRGADEVVAALTAGAHYRGPERRTE